MAPPVPNNDYLNDGNEPLNGNKGMSVRPSPDHPFKNFDCKTMANDADVPNTPNTSPNATKHYAVHHTNNNQSTTKPIMSSLPPLTRQSTTDSQTQIMHKILALLDKLQELFLCLLQLVSSNGLHIILQCQTTDPLTHLTQPNTIQPLYQTSLTLPVKPQPMITCQLQQAHSSPPLLSLWPLLNAQP